MRRKALFVFGVMLQIVFLNGCASRGPVVYQPPPLTSAEREEIQTKILNADFNIAFSSVIAVLQDDAWDLREIGKETGVIQALTKKRPDTIGPAEDWRRDYESKKQKAKPNPDDDGSIINQWTRWEKLTAHIEPWGNGQSRIRISIVHFGALPAVAYSYPVRSLFTRKSITVNAQATEEQVMVEDPVAYRKLFTKIEKAITERKQRFSK
jgi:hypothetical protein